MTQNSDTKGKIDFGTNYGDVALDLPPDWSRSRLAGDPTFMLTAVGHEHGVPDAYLTDKPKERHQFKWLNPQVQSEVSIHRTRKYAPVTKAEWSKNPDLWDWDGEGHVVYNGQILYARDEIYYVDDKETLARSQAERDRKTDPREQAAMQSIASRGGMIEDERGRPLVPLSHNK